MKKKTINAILARKHKEWVRSIEDESVRALVERNTIITGGCIASMLLGEPVNDFDMYFRDKKTAKAVAEYYVEKFKNRKQKGIGCNIWVEDFSDWRGDERIKIVVKSAGIANAEGTDEPYQYFEAYDGEGASDYVAEVMQDPGAIEDKYEQAEASALEAKNSDGKNYAPVFVSTNAITLSGKVQLIFRFYGEPEEIHKNYDFVHCTNYWTSWNRVCVLHKDALESLLSKELRYIGSRYPVCSAFRIRKFITRGWTINAGQIVKMAFQISELDLKKHDVLEDQLTGVDVAYFAEVVEKVKANDPEKVNAAYLCEIIDRMF